MEQVIVTRHPALVEYLIEKRYVTTGTPALTHCAPEDIKGKHVLGVLPLHLAAHAARVTEIPLSMPPEMRGKELSIEEVRSIAQPPRTFEVRLVAEESSGVD